MNERGRRTTPRSLPRHAGLGIWLLAALAYLPSLRSAPGKMPTDTKLYLYLNPGRLIADAPFSWDTRQFAGWVPHQTIAYLWPSGPWFWVFDKLGIPDWVAHRLWIATLLFLGGLGVRWAAKHLGLSTTAAVTAAVVYQLSPYILPYISRTSVMLLPWAAVGWLVGLTIRACGRTRWRDAALFALVVLTVGAVNATAIALIAPAPILWLVHAVWQRTINWRTAIATALKLGGLSLLVSLWWIAMLLVQGKHGADVLSFSETLDAVSLTSTGTETLRGLGYWLFYVRDPFAFTTSASFDYMTSGRVIVAGYALLVIGLAGIAITRWSQRRYAALLVFSGIVLAVGVHPIANPSPLMGPVKDSALGLAIRSSTRAIPVFNFGIALGIGALVTALGATRSRMRMVAPAVVTLIAVVNLPALHAGGLVDPALVRDQDVPAAWQQAAAQLDSTSSEYRVMQLPGSEFGAFRWGYTVDPPLPGLTDKPLVTRDLLPLGSPGAMDLLYALDNRVQNGTLEPAAVAPVVRLLGVDTIWVANDLAFDRFRTPRPEVISDFFHQRPNGLGDPVAYGTPQINVPVIGMVDEQQLSDPRLGTPLPPVELVPVKDPQSIIRASADVVVLAGSGDGMVDAAAAGLIHGNEAVLYAADLSARQLADLAPGTRVIVTDSNRDRAAQWRGSQDVSGFTETGGDGADVTRLDQADQRLAVFSAQTGNGLTGGNQTTAALDGGLTVRATAYGEPFAYRPEYRPTMAVDGDQSTAWVVGIRGDPVGESIELSTTDGSLSLVQVQDRFANRQITAVHIDQPGEPAQAVVLDDTSLTTPGQQIAVVAAKPVTIVIDRVSPRAAGADSGPSGVGFAELGPVAVETVRPPGDALAAVTAETPLDIVLTRDRVRATNRWRSDPEPALLREFSLPVDLTLRPTITLRLDQRADDVTLNALTGTTGVAIADRRLAGVPAAGGQSAIDADPASQWVTPFGQAIGATLDIPLMAGTVADQFTMVQPNDALHSQITEVRLQIGEVDVVVAVPDADATGRSLVTFPRATGDHLTLTITAVEARPTTDRRYGEIVALPTAIAEVEGLPVAPVLITSASTNCRTDLLAVDGSPLGVHLTVDDIASLVSGEAIDVTTCATDNQIVLTRGIHRIVAVPGLRTGVDIDRIVLRSSAAPPADSNGGGVASAGRPTVTVVRSRTERTATVSACPTGCWLILGEGFNPAWAADVVSGSGAGSGLGAPTQISGGFNGWWLPPSGAPRVISMVWTPQSSLDIALLLAAFGVIACIILAVVDRSGRAALATPDAPRFADVRSPVSRRSALLGAVALVALSSLVIAPFWSVIALVPAVLMATLTRVRLVAVSAAVLAGVVGLIVAQRERSQHFFANAGWPGKFEDLHRLAVFVVVLLVSACLFDGERSDA